MADQPRVNQTMRTFDYPASTVAEYGHWVLLLRPQQATLGALVMACRDEATAFSQISPAAFAEIDVVVRDAERTLHDAFAYEKINHLMLMMADPHVHFHVLPRYSGPRDFAGTTFTDPGWPRLPDLSNTPAVSEACRDALLTRLRSVWESGRSLAQ